jgi:tape measure domain-containing protein
MATELASAYLSLVPSLRGAQASINSQLAGIDTTASGNEMGEKAGRGFAAGLLGTGAIAGAAASITSKAMDVISSSISGAVSRVDTMNNFPKVMQNLGYSATDASTAISAMSDHLTGLPTALNDMTSFVQQLTATTGNLGEATNLGLAFNDAVLASGASTSEASNAMTQYNQMLAAGKVDQQAWNSLVVAMPGQMNQLAQSMLGPTANQSDLYKALQNGTVSMDAMNQALIGLDSTGVNGFASFSQQAKDATAGIGTAFENVQTAVTRSMANIIQAIGASGIAAVINDFGSVVSSLGKIVVSGIGDAKAGLSGFASDIAPSLTMVSNVINDTVGTVGAAFGESGSEIGVALGIILPNIEGFASSFNGLFANVIANAGAIISNIAGLLMDFGTSVIPALAPAIDGVSSAMQMEVGVIAGVTDAISTVIQAIDSAVSNPSFVDWITGISTAVGGFFTSVQGVYLALVPIIQQVADSVSSLIGPLFAQMESLDVASVLNGISSARSGVASFRNENTDAVSALVIGIGAAVAAYAAVQIATSAWAAVQSAAKVIQIAFAIATEGTTGALALMTAAMEGESLGAKGAAAAQAMLNAVMDANPIGIVVVALAAVAAALVYFFKQTELGRNLWQQFTDFISGAISGLQQNFSNFISIVSQGWSDFWNGISQVAMVIFSPLIAYIQLYLSAVQIAFSAIQSVVSSIWNALWSGIQSAVDAVMPTIQAVIGDGLGVIQGIVNAISSAMNGDWSGALDGMMQAASSAMSAIGDILGGLWGIVSGVFDNAGQWLIDAGGKIIQGLIDGIKGAMDDLGSFLGGIGDFIVQHKGPPSYDAEMLNGNGLLIMHSLINGFDSGKPALQSSLADTQSMFGFDAAASYNYGSNAAYSKASVDSTSSSEIAALRSDINKHLSALGDTIHDNAPTVYYTPREAQMVTREALRG